MPSLLGKTLSAATKEAEALGIELVEEGQEQSKYYDTGEICYQSAVEGTKVPVNGKIGIKISTGLTSEKMLIVKTIRLLALMVSPSAGLCPITFLTSISSSYSY